MSTFLKWAEANTFSPVPNIRVVVKVEGVEGPLVPEKSTCSECQGKVSVTGLLDVIASINWGEIHEFDLKKIVRLFRAAPCSY